MNVLNATLHGSFYSNGGGGDPVFTWTKVSGPGDVTFGSAHSLISTIHVTVHGTYVFKLTAWLGPWSISDTTQVAFIPVSDLVVDAGPDKIVNGTLSDSLNGAVFFSGGGTAVTQWTQVSGPGATTFSNAAILNPSIIVSQYGVYVYRLTATVGDVSAHDDTQYTFQPGILSPTLVLGGGGGGGYLYGGGGGGGGILEQSIFLNPSQAYIVFVGTGGLGATAPGNRGANGHPSSISTQAAPGGGGGGSGNPGPVDGIVGSSGGGGAGIGVGGGPGGSGGGASLGNTGGKGNWNMGDCAAGGGGGGMGTAGGDAFGLGPYNDGGNGGDGITSSIDGAPKVYGAGGGGGAQGSITNPGSPGAGGSGGIGGDGGLEGGIFKNGHAGQANRGSGGGGGANNGSGGNGSDGIVIVRYTGVPLWTGGTITSTGGDTVHTFTSNGNLTPL
jgi:hypothetical protein